MKLVHLSKYYKPYLGGIETVVSDIAENTSHKNVSVIAIDNKSLPKREKIKGVDVYRSKEVVNLASTPISIGYIWNTVVLSKDSILHIHLPNPLANLSVLMSYVFFRKPTKIILHWHSDIVKQKRILFFYRPLLNWLLRVSDVILVTSQTYLEHSEQLQNFTHKAKVIPIGIKGLAAHVNNDFKNEIIARYKGKKIIFSLGRHIYYKGFEYLINASLNIENAVFLIGGTGPDTHKYKKLIEEKGLQDKVILIGRVANSDLASYFSAANVFCFPSIEKSEAFGVVQLEAMSVGCPVISTNIEGSGVPWVNLNGVSGLTCMPSDVSALELSLNMLLSDDALSSSLKYGALNRFNEVFTLEKMISEIDKLYQ